ncbi:MAG: YjjG family noncanonical pyrimidine nucleotidase [Flavobacteriales bacterium]
MKPYEHLFFDLDGTLWDIRRNTRESLLFLFDKHKEEGLDQVDFENFLQYYTVENEKVWKLYRQNKIEKSVLRIVRFTRAFAKVKFAARQSFVQQFANDFSAHCPTQPHLIPGTLHMLQTLHGHLPMHIITNGFSEIQHTKLHASGITHFFRHIINSEECGARKPSEIIFRYAMEKTAARPETSLMIGDDWEADIVGARNYGMDQCWVAGAARRKRKCTMQVVDMHEFLALFSHESIHLNRS